ncbi:MAG: alpha/beta hydrolase fold protein [Mucilaginibacter sp.]|nr:alpha/beta hydrolase fold protein [Mucilaginibacter sp.]
MRIFAKILLTLFAVYIIICVILFVNQEKLIFYPTKLDTHFQFAFQGQFEEVNIKTSDNKLLNGVLFKADSSKGLIFYLHGNAGALDTWGDVAKTYTDMHYDVFMLDYRGYGKSQGQITSQRQFLEDVQLAYDHIKKKYPENKIIVLGYSIGTGAAANVAANNHPRLLILQAPYYSLTDMMKHNYPIIPTFILKYKFETYKYIQNCKMPVIIFHGDADGVIYYQSSLKLRTLFKATDTLITLHGQGHNGITNNPDYKNAMYKILNGAPKLESVNIEK